MALRRTPSNTLIVVVLCAPVFLGSLDVTVISALLPRILVEVSLSLDPEELGLSSWLITAYLVCYGASLFIMGRVSDAYGRRNALLLCLSTYIVGSMVVIFYATLAAPIMDLWTDGDTTFVELGVIVTGRIIQAFGAGAITAVSLALIGDLFTPEKRTLPLTVITAVDTVGWLIGAAWGGVFIQFLPWQAIFVVHVSIAIVVMGLIARTVPQQRRPIKLPLASGFLLLGFLLTVNVFAYIVLVEDILTILAVAVIAVGLLMAFVLVQVRNPDALVDLTFFREKGTSGATITNMCGGIALIIGMVALPLFTNVINLSEMYPLPIIPGIRDEALNRAAFDAGLYLAIFTIPLAVTSILAVRIISRFGEGITALIGLQICFVGYLGFALTVVHNNSTLIGISMLLAGSGLGFVFTPILVTNMAAASRIGYGMGSAMILGIRMVTMSAGVALLSQYGILRTNTLVRQIEEGSPLLRIISPSDYPLVFSNTFTSATLQTVQEMAVFGAFICIAANIPAIMMRSQQRQQVAAEVQP